MESQRQSRHIPRMANGQVLLVTAEPLSGALPMRTIWYVAEQDLSKAEAIIGAIMAPNEKAARGAMDGGNGAICDSVRWPFSGIGALTPETGDKDHRGCLHKIADTPGLPGAHQ